MDKELRNAIETLELFQFYLAAICAKNGEMSEFERKLISSISVIAERLK